MSRMEFGISIRRIVLEGIVILILSIFAGISYNSFSEARIPLIAPKIIDESSVSSPQERESKTLEKITIKKAYNFFESGEAIFLDARDEESYKKGHIKNAINVPYTLPIKEKLKLMSSIPFNMPLVSYCDGAECKASEGLAIELSQIGYERVMIFFGGWDDWQESNYPVEK